MKKHKHTMSTTVDRYREQKKRLADKIQARRDHKDTLFRMLFSSRENLLSLYNAVNGTHYTDPTALKVVTLENAVYMNMKNDVAFLPDLKRVHALCGACEASCEDHGGPGGGAPGCHRMHPGGDPFGFPLREPSGGDRSEYI